MTNGEFDALRADVERTYTEFIAGFDRAASSGFDAEAREEVRQRTDSLMRAAARVMLALETRDAS